MLTWSLFHILPCDLEVWHGFPSWFPYINLVMVGTRNLLDYFRTPVISSSSDLSRRPYTTARKVHSPWIATKAVTNSVTRTTAFLARQVLFVSRTGRTSTCWSPQPCNAAQSSCKRTLSIFSWCYISNLPVAAGSGSSDDSTGASATIKQQLSEQINSQLRTT